MNWKLRPRPGFESFLKNEKFDPRGLTSRQRETHKQEAQDQAVLFSPKRAELCCARFESWVDMQKATPAAVARQLHVSPRDIRWHEWKAWKRLAALRIAKVRQLQEELPTIRRCALDWDDVVKDTIQRLSSFYNDYAGATFSPHDYHSYYLDQVWPVTPEEAVRICRQFHQAVGIDIPYLPGAVDGVMRLAQQMELDVITGRCDAETDITVREVGEHLRGHICKVEISNQYSGPKRHKVDICHANDCALIIDDSVTTAAECSAAGIWVLMPNRPWNQLFRDTENPKVIRVMGDWQEYLEILTRPAPTEFSDAIVCRPELYARSFSIALSLPKNLILLYS